MTIQHVFISHNKTDKDIAREIAVFLAAEEITPWFDEWEISPGDSIVEKINSGLMHCTHFLILWSKNASESSWVQRELNPIISKFTKSKKPTIIPIKLDDTPLPFLLEDIRYIKLGKDIETNRITIIESITGSPPISNFIRMIVKKYHSTIYDDNVGGPYKLVACPECGGNRLKEWGAFDTSRDEDYPMIECDECGWNAG